jgi:Secretion system C-terminal sorting domain
MKTFLPFKQTVAKSVTLVLVCLFIQQAASAQALSFKSPVKQSGTALQKGAEYRFSDVATNVDALVKIEDLINGAEVREIDQTGGLGYDAAFQPLVYSPGGTGTSYALFSVKFVQKATNSSVNIADFSATSLDLDGNSKLKEFSEITMSGSISTMNYMTATVQIAVTPVSGGFKGANISGVEYSGIDTSALSAMYTVKRTTVGSFNLKLGAISVGASSASRQYSVYMKDFSYNINTLPVKMYSFTANLNNSKVDLKWITASEINVSHFIVEKSTDGVNFSEAGLMFAYGNAIDKTNYSLSDNVNTNQTGVIYYRLRSFDIDGKSELSETRIIRIGKQTEKNISIVTYPNPVSNEVRITIPANWQNKKVVYEIFNAAGKAIKKIETANSSQTETMNVSSFAPGFYIIRVSFDGQIAQQKIVKH